MSDIVIYKWDPEPNYTSNFSLTTKYYDFSSVHINKNIYSISLTLGVQEGETVILNNNILIQHRSKLEDDWQVYGLMAFGQTGVGTNTIKNKLRNVPGLQLKLSGFLIDSCYINDISIEYRIRRKQAVATPQ
tara:strand:+ start:2270 stop:2665 length:396 start_codon:yes stop_codon:yes gene_type:complete